MADITLDGLPAKTGTIDDAAVLHMKEAGVDKKVTIASLLAKIASVYSSFVNSFLATTSAYDARDVLEIDRRVAVNNANYTILNTDRVVAQIGTVSAARTFTLPAANTFRAGGELLIIDESGSVTDVNKIIVSRSGADAIDGATSIDIDNAYGFLNLVSDGTDSWKIANNFKASSVEAVAGTNDSKFLTPLSSKAALDNYTNTLGFAGAAVRFTGAVSPVILASKNVSSITRLASGNYRINFTAPMPNANYYVTAVCQFANYTPTIGIVTALTTSVTVQIQKWDNASFTSFPDLSNISIMIFKS